MHGSMRSQNAQSDLNLKLFTDNIDEAFMQMLLVQYSYKVNVIFKMHLRKTW